MVVYISHLSYVIGIIYHSMRVNVIDVNSKMIAMVEYG